MGIIKSVLSFGLEVSDYVVSPFGMFPDMFESFGETIDGIAALPFAVLGIYSIFIFYFFYFILKHLIIKKPEYKGVRIFASIAFSFVVILAAGTDGTFIPNSFNEDTFLKNMSALFVAPLLLILLFILTRASYKKWKEGSEDNKHIWFFLFSLCLSFALYTIGIFAIALEKFFSFTFGASDIARILYGIGSVLLVVSIFYLITHLPSMAKEIFGSRRRNRSTGDGSGGGSGDGSGDGSGGGGTTGPDSSDSSANSVSHANSSESTFNVKNYIQVLESALENFKRLFGNMDKMGIDSIKTNCINLYNSLQNKLNHDSYFNDFLNNVTILINIIQNENSDLTNQISINSSKEKIGSNLGKIIRFTESKVEELEEISQQGVQEEAQGAQRAQKEEQRAQEATPEATPEAQNQQQIINISNEINQINLIIDRNYGQFQNIIRGGNK